MELKRTARDITGKRRDLPGHISVRTGIQAAAGYAFTMGILEKYRQAEGYDLPSASFVYLDPQGAEEEQEAATDSDFVDEPTQDEAPEEKPEA